MREDNKEDKLKIASSFRDSSGFLFLSESNLYRQVNFLYKEHYDHLMNSGLFSLLEEKNLLIPHKEIKHGEVYSLGAYKIVQPDIIPFISYPYEWCFSQLKDAALTTLQIQKHALEFGMILKDASAYNIQFLNGKPILIDTLSFEVYKEGLPWIAYKQFCQHFLAPLALMSYCNVHLGKLMQIYIDGIPLDLASSLLPYRLIFKISLYAHIHLQAKMQRILKKQTRDLRTYHLSKKGLIALIDNLESIVLSLNWKAKNTEWADYYEETNYSSEAFKDKREIIKSFISKIAPAKLWDMGANNGVFSRIASGMGIETVGFDIDPAAVEKNYIEMKKNQERNILPLILDVTNPSPAIGWANEERYSLKERGPADAIFALAMIHHLVITNNIPFSHIAEFFNKISSYLIIEFIPKEDSQVQKMLVSSIKIFPDYTLKEFELVFKKYFSILDVKPIKDSKRILYLMKRR